MALQLRQSLSLTQQLIMTPQLQQAIKLLQLSRLELLDTLYQERDIPSFENFTAQKTNFYAHLFWARVFGKTP